MAIWYQDREMREFDGKEINDSTKNYQIIRIEEDETSGFSESKEFIHEQNLTKAEAKRKVEKLNSPSSLLE